VAFWEESMVEFYQMLTANENLLFLTSLLVFCALLSLQMFGFIADGVGGEFFGLDMDMDVDVDGDVGMGDVAQFPIVTLLMLFSGSFGILGILFNLLLDDFFNLGTAARVVISIVLSGAVSLLGSRLTARTVGSWLPTVETHGLDGTSLNGCVATVISATMTSEELGRISVTDKKAGNYKLRGQLLEGHGEVANGGLVVVVRHDQNSDVCFCVPAADWSMPRE
jgi:hypothetical protein